MYKTERLKHLIGEASFDGWVENDGPNCDGSEEHVQLLKQDRANEIIAEMIADFPKVIQKGKDSEYICLLPGEVEEIADWLTKWLTSPLQDSSNQPDGGKTQ